MDALTPRPTSAEYPSYILMSTCHIHWIKSVRTHVTNEEANADDDLGETVSDSYETEFSEY